MNADEDEVVPGLVQALSECGDLATRLVHLHVADGRGACVICSRSTQAGRYAFPCAIRSLATRALHLQATRHGGVPLEKTSPGSLG